MKMNRTTRIVGDTVILVPYDKDHVPKYHSWMLQKELRDATGSELLTLEQEYIMQESWREDENKCTFIIADKALSETTKSEAESMIGDVNLFLRDDEDKRIGEVNIMIAEKLGRRQGRGFEALCHMLNYGMRYLNLDKFEAKILFGNTASVNLFQKAGFHLEDTSEVFQEATFTVDVTQEWKNWLTEMTKNSNILP